MFQNVLDLDEWVKGSEVAPFFLSLEALRARMSVLGFDFDGRPWRSKTEIAPSDQRPEIGHRATKITESCRCQTCEVKAVRVCTSTPKKNRSIVWMILLVL